jgi:hypothetical protein
LRDSLAMVTPDALRALHEQDPNSLANCDKSLSRR